ncbi:Glucosidase YgjK [bacterium HR34]|nr:Glucosidase YgjK [bacterium HR34]
MNAFTKLRNYKIEQKIKEDLFEKAKKVLDENWVELPNGLGYTRPADKLYPFQWNWDSGFTAYGYCHYDIEKAIKEMDSLFFGQWKNGFLPSIVFHIPSVNYFTNAEFWNVKKVTDQAPNVDTSGISQPPVHALAIWHIYKKLLEKDYKKAIKFLEEYYPRLFKLHKYYLEKRDPEGTGLVTIYHPWESGFDNSPRWDEILSRIKVDKDDIPPYKRHDINVVDKKYRPSDEDYDKYVYLAILLKNNGYEDERIYRDHPFRIKDKVFSTILYIANKRLLAMSGILKTGDDNEIKEWMRRFEFSFYHILWNEEDKLCYDFDLTIHKQIKIKSVDSLLPVILAGIFPRSKIKQLAYHLDSVNFCGKNMCKVKLLPSLDIRDERFSQYLYWRGPIWINVNWLIWKGFMEYQLKERARDFQIHILNLVNREGFWEYYSPLTGKGLGADNFSWTAALTIDLLNHL